ncbi:50S ribosomal protein L11 methyltransferase [soil metagenome]
MNAAPAVTVVLRVDGLSMEEVSDRLAVAGIAPDGLSEERGVTSIWFDAQPADGSVETAVDHPCTWEEVRRADWAEEWKKGLEPVTVGRVTILPPWLAPDGPVLPDPSSGDPIVLVIEPGMAFGTGHHETTTACLRLLQQEDLHGRRVIDIGTGTGVLALAARAMGARSVSAVDNDPEATTVAAANLAAHPLDGIELALGSCADAGDPGDVVVANIITDKLLALVPDLVELVVPGGTLIASGIALDRVEEAASVLAGVGIDTTAHRGREWAALVGQRPSA